MVSIAEPPCYNHIINGQDTPPKENAYIDVICPATGKIIALTETLVPTTINVKKDIKFVFHLWVI